MRLLLPAFKIASILALVVGFASLILYTSRRPATSEDLIKAVIEIFENTEDQGTHSVADCAIKVCNDTLWQLDEGLFSCTARVISRGPRVKLLHSINFVTYSEGRRRRFFYNHLSRSIHEVTPPPQPPEKTARLHATDP